MSPSKELMAQLEKRNKNLDTLHIATLLDDMTHLEALLEDRERKLAKLPSLKNYRQQLDYEIMLFETIDQLEAIIEDKERALVGFVRK